MAKTTLGVTGQNGWTAYAPASFVMVGDMADEMAYFTGSVMPGSIAIGTVIAKANVTGLTLFPQMKKSFIVANDLTDDGIRLDVTPIGEIRYMGGLPAGNPRVYLDGISFILGA